MPYKTIATKKIHTGRTFDVRQDQVLLPDGNTSSLDILEHKGAVTILPIDTDGNIWFVRQYRHAIQSELLEIPAGGLEPGEDSADCAQRELQEEIGFAAREIKEIGTFFLAPGYSSERLHVFLATDLYPSTLAGDADEFLTVDKMPLSQLFELAEKGEIKDAKTMAALLLLRGQHLNK